MSDEGIGGRKFSLLDLNEPDEGGDRSKRFLMDGTAVVARLDCVGARLPGDVRQHPTLDGDYRLAADGAKLQALLVAAPQLWDAANELCKLIASGKEAMGSEQAVRLAACVAKSVGKTVWKDVAQ